MSDVLTSKLNEFSDNNLKELSKIFKLLSEKKLTKVASDYFYTKESIEFFKNKNSGFIFVCDADYNTILINPKKNKLDLWLNSPYHGIEGFLSIEFINNIFKNNNSDDIEFILHYKVYLNKKELKFLNKKLKEYRENNDY